MLVFFPARTAFISALHIFPAIYPVELDIPFDPVGIGSLRMDRIVIKSHDITYLIKEPFLILA